MTVNKRRVILVLNVILGGAILFFLALKLAKSEIIVNGTYGAKPYKLISLIEKNFPNLPNKEIEAVFVFNSIPTTSQIQSIEKLYEKVNQKANIIVLFRTRLKTPFKINFPY